MSEPDPSAVRPPDRGPLAVLVLNVVGAVWVVAGLALGGTLRESENILGEGGDLSDSIGAVLVAVLCGVAATVAFGAAAIVGEVSRRNETGAERG